MTRQRDRRGERGATPPDSVPDGQLLDGWVRRHATGVIVAGVVLNLLLCLALFEPKIHTGGDSSSYVLLAESVLRLGDGYADNLTAGPPVPHTQYPPGFPALLAPLVALFGRNLVILKSASVLFTLTSVLAFSLLARGRTSGTMWALLTLAFAANPLLVDYSRWILSEAPFLATTLIALLFLQKAQDSEEVGRPFWWGVLASAAAFYIRSVGAVLLAAGSIVYLVNRKWKKFFLHSAVGAALCLPWLVRNKLLKGAATPYLEQFLLKSVYEPEAGHLGLVGMVGRFFNNVSIYSAREIPRLLVGSDSLWSVSPLFKVLAVALCLVMMVGFAYNVMRRLGVIDAYFALNCLAILLFEEVVSDVRYLLPLLPIILLYVTDGMNAIAGRFRELRPASKGAVAAMALVACIGITAQLARIPANIQMLERYSAGDRYAGYPPNWRTFFEAADWVKGNTPADAVITVRKPRLFNLWTNRKVFLYPFTADVDSLLAGVMETDYVVVDRVSGTTFRYLVPALESSPERFSAVFQTGSPTSWVLKVNR